MRPGLIRPGLCSPNVMCRCCLLVNYSLYRFIAQFVAVYFMSTFAQRQPRRVSQITLRVAARDKATPQLQRVSLVSVDVCPACTPVSWTVLARIPS